ncbi:MAG: ubiquinone biosynthesis protein UbiB, partial [Jatrophihabitans endophyticus]
MKLRLGSFFRLARAGFTLARAGVFDDVDTLNVPPSAKLPVKLARLVSRKKAGSSLDALPAAISKLGPSYVKLGQFLATRPDVVGAK